MKFDDDDITLPDNPEDFMRMLEELAKLAKEDMSLTKEEFDAKYGFDSSATNEEANRKESKPSRYRGKIVVPIYDMHTFDMHWMLHHLDLFRDGISLKEYVRRARRDGSDITMKWYNIVEKYRFSVEGIQRIGRQELGYKGRQLLEQLDVYVDMYSRKLESREQQLAGTWKPRYEWEKTIEGDNSEKLKEDRKLFKRFQQQYQIINEYYPELPDIASIQFLSKIQEYNKKNFPEIDWDTLYAKYEDAEIYSDTSIKELAKIGLLDKKIAADCKAHGIKEALDLLMNTPLQYHALVERNYTDNPAIINPQMDAKEANPNSIGSDYDSLSLAKLNFARAVIADQLWGDV